LESAAAYPYLRGLFGLPLGLLFVLAALGNWSWGPLRHDWVFVVVLALLLLACVPINHYYNENFGRVTPTTRQQLRAGAACAAGVGIIVLGSMLLRSRASWSLDLPVNGVAATFGLLMLVYYAAVVGLRTHHVVIWGALVVTGLLPVWDGADPSNVGLVLAGAAVAVNGLLDHRLLVRTLAPPTPPALGPTHAEG
jgi:hypothetical protein